MKHDWFKIAWGFIALIFVAALVDDFKSNLERHHHANNPIKEIEVEDRIPLTIEQMMIRQCPSVKGDAMVFISCYKGVKKMLRTDI